MNKGEETMTVKEAADLLEVDRSTITRAVKDGRLTTVRQISGIVKRKAYLLNRDEVLKYATPEQTKKYQEQHAS